MLQVWRNALRFSNVKMFSLLSHFQVSCWILPMNLVYNRSLSRGCHMLVMFAPFHMLSCLAWLFSTMLHSQTLLVSRNLKIQSCLCKILGLSSFLKVFCLFSPCILDQSRNGETKDRWKNFLSRFSMEIELVVLLWVNPVLYSLDITHFDQISVA